MVARLVAFEELEPAAADEALRWMRETALPAARGLRGFRGAAALLRRESRRLLVVTFFETEEDLRAAEPRFEETAAAMADDLRTRIEGSVRPAEVFEVALDDGFAGGGAAGAPRRPPAPS